MKQFFTLCAIVAMFLQINAQDIVVTSPQLKNVILEEYTGINCPYCPYGHEVAEEIYDGAPNRVAIVNVHTGSYATPSGTQPDFRTDFGPALASEASVNGFPMASVNRHLFAGITSGGTAMSRGDWPAAADIILEEASYVNVGFETIYDEGTRELTVNVELYYVEDAPFMVDENFINLVLTENLVYGYQANGGTNYEHNHILRHMITGQWGDEVNDFSQGTLVERTYTYTVPEDWNADNCEITCFVAEGRSEIITGGVADLVDDSFNGLTQLDFGRLHMTESISTAEAGSTADLSGNFLVGDTVDATYHIELIADQPEDWTVSYTVDGNDYTESVDLTLLASQNYPLMFHVTPGVTNGVGHYVIEISSDRFPNADPKIAEFYLVKGVTDLVVNGSGTFTGVNSADYQGEYLDALHASGSETCGAISAQAMEAAFEGAMLDDVQNIFLNISYTHPSLSDNQIELIEDFIDAGGNLLIAGQDIGWDAMAVGGYGTIKMKLFFANYIQATYSNDGDPDDNDIYTYDDEKLFGGLGSGNIVGMYSTELSADKIYAAGNAVPVLGFEPGRAAVAGIRSTKEDAKIVYLTFGLEQVISNQLRDSLMSRTYQWFTGQIEIGIQSELFYEQTTLYPNPVLDFLQIENQEIIGQEVTVRIFSPDGRLVFSKSVTWMGTYVLPVNELVSSLYLIEIETESQRMVKRFVKE